MTFGSHEQFVKFLPLQTAKTPARVSPEGARRSVGGNRGGGEEENGDQGAMNPSREELLFPLALTKSENRLGG